MSIKKTIPLSLGLAALLFGYITKKNLHETPDVQGTTKTEVAKTQTSGRAIKQKTNAVNDRTQVLSTLKPDTTLIRGDGKIEPAALSAFGVKDEFIDTVVELVSESRNNVSSAMAKKIQLDQRPEFSEDAGWQRLFIPGDIENINKEDEILRARLGGLCGANVAERISNSLDQSSSVSKFGALDIYLTLPPPGPQRETGYILIETFDPATGDKISETDSIDKEMSEMLLGRPAVDAIYDFGSESK